MKAFLQKGRAPLGMVLPAKAQAQVNDTADKSTLAKWGKGGSGAKPNIQKVEANTKDLKPLMTAEILPAVDPPKVDETKPEETKPAVTVPEDASTVSGSKETTKRAKSRH